MSDSADELLDELEQLEHATEEMRQDVNEATDKKSQLNSMDNSQKVEAAILSLEAAKTSQTAASQSHSAAEATIKLAHDQKAQIMDLSDSNIAWRQALRSASNDLSSAKKSIAIMMGTTMTLSVISIGVIGFLYYSLNNKYEALKGDVLDIIATENTLFNKGITLKVDQLSSLIEALAADIQKLNISSMMPKTANKNMSNEATDSPEAVIDSPSSSEPLLDLGTEITPQQPPKEVEKAVSAVQPMPAPAKEKLIREVTKVEKVYVEPSQEQIEANLKPLSSLYQQKLTDIEKMVSKIIDAQQTLQSAAMTESAKHQQAPLQNALTDAQVKQLNAIASDVAQQGKLLQSIQATLKKQKQVISKDPASAKSLKRIEGALWRLNKQMKALKAQQTSVQSKVQTLQSTTNKLEKKVGESKPYSYRSKTPSAPPPEDQLNDVR